MDYSWEGERDNIQFCEAEVNKIIGNLGLKVDNYTWLPNPDGQHSVNKVFKVNCIGVEDSTKKTLVVKVIIIFFYHKLFYICLKYY